jgi:hypothetical protein
VRGGMSRKRDLLKSQKATDFSQQTCVWTLQQPELLRPTSLAETNGVEFFCLALSSVAFLYILRHMFLSLLQCIDSSDGIVVAKK